MSLVEEETLTFQKVDKYEIAQISDTMYEA
jgi:hypothetical protein